MSTQPLDLRSINSILAESFFIPKYQRGYRWTPTQVTELLDDILEFFKKSKSSNNPNEFYCIQPLVVTKNDGSWEVVDGQQRLTTIYLILNYLKGGMEFLGKEKYKLSYATRLTSAAFLNNPTEKESKDNIDYYHIYEAYKAIDKWFKGQDGTVKQVVLSTLLNDDEIAGKNVKFIWYEIQKTEAVDVFTRINMGKIPLTNAELIKALFLREGNFEMKKGENSRLHLKQLEIATEWDKIENILQQPSFWYFIHDNNEKYDTRIEFIFDLIKGKELKENDEKENFTFLAYLEDLKNRNINDVWLEIKQYFMRLEEWYNDHELYHLIGYLIATGSKVNKLLDAAKVNSKSGFIDYLKDLIIEKFKKTDLENVSYNSEKSLIRHILLLFNIETILQNPKSSIRFPFNNFKEEKWDIEHISSVMSDMPGPKQSLKWLRDVMTYFMGNTFFDYHTKAVDDNEKNDEVTRIQVAIQGLLDKEGNYNEDEFKVVYDLVLTHFKEDYKEGEEFTNSLGNLTLLDLHTNRSYKNAIFPVKRKRILENDKNGYFIPICTKNVFLKYYSEQFSDVLFWQESDADSYFKTIEKTLAPYFSTSKTKS
jgi:uncharacterized protein with ParB-like and HNH nuclease domain